MSYPLVSVLMASYNAEKYIGDAIQSVLDSTYKNFELIICDDCSTDRTLSISYSYQKFDSRIKIFVNESNLGDYPNRNRAASYAVGTYLKYLDHDDIIYPWGLEVMVKSMEQFQEAGFGIISYGLPQQTPYPILVTPREGYLAFFSKGALFAMGPTGAIFRKSAFDDVNGFSGKPFVGDTEIWLSMATKYSFVRMPLDLVWYRVHDIQESKREHLDPEAILRRFNVLKFALLSPECPLTDEERNHSLRNHYNLRIRLILTSNLLNFNFINLFLQLKKFKFNFFDILLSFKRSKKIQEKE